MYHLLVMTPEKKFFEGEVHSLITHGSLGYFEILSNHAPFTTPLKPGKLEIVDKDQKKLTMNISGGMLEVSDNNCSILADSIEN